MSRYTLVVGADPGLFDRVRQALLADPRFIDAGDALHCDGSVAPLTNIYPVEMTVAEWDGLRSVAGQMPDPQTMSVLLFECRSPAWVAEVGTLLAGNLDTPVWFIDSADTVWPSGSVDPERITLD